MVHKSSIIPGLSNFLDQTVLSHYPPTSMKRIAMAVGLSLYLKNNEKLLDNLLNNPLFAGLQISTAEGNIMLEPLRDALKSEISKAGFMRVTIPIAGDVDFTPDDVDTLYKLINDVGSARLTNAPQAIVSSGVNSNGGVY